MGIVEEYFFRPDGAFIHIVLSPGAYAPGYAFLRPFGPDKMFTYGLRCGLTLCRPVGLNSKRGEFLLRY